MSRALNGSPSSISGSSETTTMQEIIEENKQLRKQIAELQERLLAQYQMMEITTKSLSENITMLALEREESLCKTEELKVINAAISESLQIIEHQRKQIMESIRYASHIQHVLFFKWKQVAQVLPNSFFLHLPKEQLSGDFIFAMKKRHLIYIALGDCTGHGVPASMLTIIANMLLSRLIEEADTYITPSQVIHTLDFLFNEQITGQDANLRDGLTMGLCIIDTKENTLHYSGAQQSLYHMRHGVMHEYKGSRDTVGWCLRGYLDKSFATISIPFEKGGGDCFYMASDGFADQFNSEGRKLTRKNFKKILENLCGYPVVEQENLLRDIFFEWKNNSKQIDDVAIVGFCI